MVSPITWRNVEMPSIEAATKAMALGQQGINTGFEGFNNLIKQRETTDQANWDQGKLNNTNAFLSASQEAKTPDEFAAKEAQLRQMLGGYGAQVDSTAARNALDGRMAMLQARAEQDLRYGQLQRTEEQRGLSTHLATMAANGQTDAVRQILAVHPELEAGAKLATDVKAFDRRLVEEGQKDTRFGFDQAQEKDRALMAPLDRAAKNASIRASDASAAHSRAQASRALQESTKIKNEGSLNALAKAGYTEAYKQSIMSNGVIGMGKGTDNLSKGLKDSGIAPEFIKDIMENVQKEFPNGIPAGKDAKGTPLYKPVPVDFVLRAAQQSTQHWRNLPSLNLGGMGEHTTETMQNMLKDPKNSILEELAQGYDLHSKLYEAPLEREQVGSFVDPRRVDTNDPAMGGTASRAAAQTAFKNATANTYGVTTAPSMAEERLARAKAEAEKKSPEIAVLSSVATPKGAEDFSIHSVTGKVQRPSGPAVIPPDAKVTSSFTAVKLNPNFMPLKDTGMVTATVTGVEDGDGAYLKTKGTNRDLTCRLAGIDAPEVDHPKVGKKGQAFGEEAKTSLMKKILNQEVEVNVTKANDSKGRSICQITLKGRNINREELVEGAAWVNKTYNKNPEDIAAFENARTLKKGLHADTNAIPPWEHRKTW